MSLPTFNTATTGFSRPFSTIPHPHILPSNRAVLPAMKDFAEPFIRPITFSMSRARKAAQFVFRISACFLAFLLH